MVGFHDSLPRELAGFIASAFGPIHHLDVKRVTGNVKFPKVPEVGFAEVNASVY